MFILLIAACGRTTAPADQAEGSADTGAVYEPGDDAQLARYGRPRRPLHRFFHDADADGFGAPGSGLWANRKPVGYVQLAGDCDDTDATVYPGAGCPGRDTGDTGADTGADTAADTGPVDSGDTAPADTAGSDTATGDTGVADTGIPAVTGIVVTRDSSGGLTYPADIHAWYGSSSYSTATVASASEQLVFSPSTADLADHSWVDIQASWSAGANWSDDCTGFSVTSVDFTVALYEKTVGGSSSDTCRIYVGLAVPSGGDTGVWTLVP